MPSIPFAFSVHHFINSVGSYAGFAAIIGLAILVLLYFAQARETASLREQAYEAAQHIQRLEHRIMQLARQPAAPSVQAQPMPAAQPAGGPVREPAGSRTGAPAAGRTGTASALATAPEVGAPAGVGAPALTAATKLIPAGAIAAGYEPFHGDESDLTTVGSPAPAPATVAGGSNGVGHTATAPPPVGAPAGSPRGGRDSATVPPPPRVQIRPSSAAIPARRTAPAGRKPAPEGASVGRRILVGLLAVLIVAGVVVALFVITNSGSKSNTSARQTANQANTTATTGQHRHRPSAAFTPSSVTVSVLNGTATAQLAHRVATKLTGIGYKQGTVATAADQTRTATVVAYLPGHQRDALAVAKSLKLGPASVQPIDQNTQAVACPPGTACAAGVVVTVGSDLANIQ